MKRLNLGRAGLAALLACTIIFPGVRAVAADDGKPAAAGLTKAERTQLLTCLGLASNAMGVATQRLRGTKVEAMKSFYAGKPQEKLLLALVDKVYADEVTNAWEYAAGFYQECVPNMTQVSEARAKPATKCAFDALIAEKTRELRASGQTLEQANGYFTGFPPGPRAVIAGVYAADPLPEPGAAGLKVWDDCIAPLAAAEPK